MGIGGSIALLVIGAILAFAVRDTDLGGWLDINVVGWVLILAGLVGLSLTLWVWSSRRRRVVTGVPPTATTTRYVDPAPQYVDPAQDPQVVERRYIRTERNY